MKGRHEMYSESYSSISKCSCGCPVKPFLNDTFSGANVPAVRRRRFASGKNIAREWVPITGLCVVVSGVVKISESTKDGEQWIKSFVFPGEFIKLLPWSSVPSGDVRALTNVVVCDIDYQWGEQDEFNSPEIDRALLFAAAWEKKHSDLWQRVMISRKPCDRVISFLIDVAGRSACDNRGECVIELPMTHSDIADYLGLQRETVSRSFTELRNAGLITFLNRKTCLIRAIEKLSSLVDFNGSESLCDGYEAMTESAYQSL